MNELPRSSKWCCKITGHWVVWLDPKPSWIWYELLRRQLFGIPDARSLQHNQSCYLSGKSKIFFQAKKSVHTKAKIVLTLIIPKLIVSAAVEPKRSSFRWGWQKTSSGRPSTMLCPNRARSPHHALHRGFWQKSSQPAQIADRRRFRTNVWRKQKKTKKEEYARSAESGQLWKHVCTELRMSVTSA